MKKIFSIVLTLIMILGVGCTNSNTKSTDIDNEGKITNDFDSSRVINVITREDGSGTRGAFTEIVGILEEDENGNENDRTYIEAVVQNGTDAVMTTVTGDKYSIGYISLGSLNDTVKTLKIDGVQANSANVQNGSYKIARPFNIAYKDELSSLGKDFLNFILSSEGQEIIVEEGYVQVSEDLPTYKSNNEQEGSLVVAGSTSVSPVMEKLAETYEEIHSGISVEIQSTGSSAGIRSAIEGTADIGMASRELKESELAELTNEVIAVDGIAVIINNSNPLEDLTLDEVKSIYIGNITEWLEVE